MLMTWHDYNTERCILIHSKEQHLVVKGNTTTSTRVCIQNILKVSVHHIHPQFEYDSGKHFEIDVLYGVLFFWSKQNTWASSKKWRGFTLFMTYVFYLLSMWLKSCSSQIPFIPQSTASYHILNNPLVPCLMWIWKAHFTKIHTADVHLVAKFGNGLKVKFVRTPHTANFFATHLQFIVSEVHHVHTLPDTELHTHSNQIWINFTLC
jgi:hypothetical protein